MAPVIAIDGGDGIPPEPNWRTIFGRRVIATQLVSTGSGSSARCGARKNLPLPTRTRSSV